MAVVDNDILSHIDTTNWNDTKKAQAKSAAKTALLAFKDGVQVNGITYKVNRTSRREYTRSNDTERAYRKAPDAFADKMRAAANADDIITATTSWANDGHLTHPRDDNFVDFAHGEVLLQAGQNQYEAETVVGITKDGEYVFYDVVDMKPTSFKTTEEPSTTATSTDAVSDIQEDSSGGSIAENGLPVKEQFSFSELVEQTDKLLAMHNMDEEKIRRTLELGAWPSPSIAIVQATQGHTSYGEYSAIFPRSAIDPELDARNKVYGSDAWTPTHSNALVEREVNQSEKRAFEKTIADLSGAVADGAFQSGGVLGRAGVNDSTSKSIREIAEQISGYSDVMAAYLASQGGDVEVQHKEKNYHRFGNEALRRYIASMSAQELAALDFAVETRDSETIEAETQRVRQVLEEVFREEIGRSRRENGEPFPERVAELRLKRRMENVQGYQIESFIQSAWQMLQDGSDTTDIDKSAMTEDLESKVDRRAVASWAEGMLADVLGESGVYNGEEIYTENGRKSFQETHMPLTAENIVKAMYSTAASRGEGAYGMAAGGLQSVASPSYQTVEEIREDSHRLGRVSDEELEARKNEIDEILAGLYEELNELPGANAYNIPGAVVNAAGERYIDDVIRSFERDGIRGMSDDTALRLVEVFEMAAQLPTEYFEAKPERVVNFEEAAAVLAPDNAPIELLAQMRAAGMNVVEYEAGNDAQRLEIANSLNTQFSISGRTGEQKQEVLANLRRYMNGEMSTRDIRNYIDGLDDAGYDQPINLQTYEQSEAQEIVDAAHGQNMSVDEYLRYNWEQFERDGELNDAAKEALQLERRQGRRQYSMDGDTRSTLPVKAQQYLRRTERELLEKVSNALSVPAFARREYLQDIVREISDEYLASGTVRQETIDRLFETAYDEGIVVDDEYYREYKHIKDHLRTQAITISEQDKHNIADFNDFRKSAFGSLRIVNDGGLPVDTAYQELQGMAGELFPDDITHPADQLVRMFEVARSIEKTEKSLNDYYGRDAEEFKRWAKNDFDTAIYEAMGELRNVRRYAEERTQTETQQQLTTQEDVAEAYKLLKEARRSYEKAAAKNLLTDHDNVQVGRLLKGEIELEHLDPAKDNIKGITAVYEAKQEYERLTKLIKEWNTSRKAQLREQADEYLQTANDWKDKKAGILYSRETMERNILDIVKDKKLAKDIIGEYFTPVHEAQAKATKLKNKYRERVKALNLSTKETRAMQKRGQVSEAHAVQLIGEAMDNIRMLENSRGRMEQRDGKTLSDWRGIVQDLWAQNPQLDKAKIEHAIEEFRKIYDELFQMMNDSRLRNGYEPVNYRKGYFPHFQPGDGDGIMGLFGRALGISTDVAALPTTINGLTHTFKPGIQWFGNAQERLGFNTAYDAVEGFDKYIEGVADVIYQTDNIQRLRALATQTRYRTGEEGIRKQVDAVYADTTLSEQDKQNRIEKIYENGRYALSNFVVELEEYTNMLANKKSRADRNMEQALGRDMYNLVKALESRVAANMVAVNPASWLTNFIPLTQGGAQLNRGELLRGMWQTLRAYKESDGIVDASTFLTNRRGSDPLVRTWAQKASAKLSSPMEFIDCFTADSLVRARYNQNLKQGLSEAEAMSEADSWAAGVMADRSKGSTPTLFQRSNPLTKVFTQFQLEVNNQLSYLFKDMPREQKDRGLAALAAALIKFFLGAWLYDEVYEYFIGRRPALDPIGILNETVGDITGYELPNLVELGVGAVTGDMPSFRTERQNAYDTATNLLTTTAEELPFIGGILGGGRVPISSALPDWDNLLKTVTSDTWSTKKKLATAGKELMNPASYLLLPFGGGQLKKIYQGLEAVIRGGSYSVDAEGNDLLQYPVFNDNPWDTAVAAGQAMLFGKTSLPTGRDWIESGFKSFGAKETAAYQAMTDAGVPDEDAYELLRALRGAKKTETESKAAQERRLLQEADISGDGKSVAYYGLMASDKERELMDAMTDMNADMGAVTQVLMDVKGAGDLTGAAASNAKRTALAESALTDPEKQTMYRYLFGTKQEDGTYTTGRDDDIMAFEQAGLDMDTFLQVQNEYSGINEEYGGASEKATEFSRWVNSQGFTPEQATVVKDCFTYYSQIPAEAARYEKFVAAGLEDETAYELANTINALEPMDGKDSVTDEQKWRAVVDSGMTADEQLAALEAVSTESQYRKFSVAYDFGVVPDAYVTARETMPKFDADGNGSYKNDEITAAINSLGASGGGLVLPGGSSISLTNDQKAALWQLLTGSTSAKNNPYSASVGWAVIDAVNAMKEGNTGIVLPDGTNYTGGIVLPEA